ncbi:MAG: Ig-like domain-containing protein [Lachnospiraceae bacterium]|nr:Ig-like domain-containing protein [Lachnospiraceae bacterium]
MSILKIKLNPYKNLNTALLDEKPCNQYSELSNYIKEPFLNWADRLLESAENEINDNYSLIVIGENFERLFLQDMQNDYDACLDYGTDDYDIDFLANDRYQKVLPLAKKYGVSFNLAKYKIGVCSDVELPSSVSFASTPTDVNNAFLIVTRDTSIESTIVRKNGPCMALVLSEKSVVHSLGNARYIWEITEDRLSEVINAIVDRFVKVPFVVSISNDLRGFLPQMDEEDREKYALLTEIDMYVSVGEIPNIEVGNDFELSINTIPEDNGAPDLVVESSNPSVLAVEGNKLIALASGNVQLKIYRADEIIPFDERDVVVYQTNFISQMVVSGESEMGIGRVQELELSVIPEDAEDSGSIEWFSSDEAVVKVDKNGRVTSLAAGKATISVKSTKVTADYEIEVLPNIQEIKTSIRKAHLYVGDTKPITVNITPKKCFDDSCKWETSDSKVALVEISDNGKTVIRATGVGDCVLTCTAIEGGCSASCAVKVEATFKKREKNSSFLGLSLFCTVVAIFCTFFSYPIGILIAGGMGVILGVIAIIVNWRDFVWACIFIALSAAMVLNHFEIIDIISFFNKL